MKPIPNLIKIGLMIFLVAGVSFGVSRFRPVKSGLPKPNQQNASTQVAGSDIEKKVEAVTNVVAPPVKNVPPAKLPSADEVYENCETKASASDIFACYKNTFKAYTLASDPRQTLFLLDALQQKGGYVNTNCHILAHEIGRTAIQIYGSFLVASKYYEPICVSGYYHGLFQEYLSTRPNYEETVKTICGHWDEKSFYDWFQCVHGVAHGIMEHRGQDVLRSLNDCDLIDPDHAARLICYGGVVMQNSVNDLATRIAAKSPIVDITLFPFPCVQLPDKTFVDLDLVREIYAFASPQPTDALEPKDFLDTEQSGVITKPCKTPWN